MLFFLNSRTASRVRCIIEKIVNAQKAGWIFRKLRISNLLRLLQQPLNTYSNGKNFVRRSLTSSIDEKEMLGRQLAEECLQAKR